MQVWFQNTRAKDRKQFPQPESGESSEAAAKPSDSSAASRTCTRGACSLCSLAFESGDGEHLKLEEHDFSKGHIQALKSLYSHLPQWIPLGARMTRFQAKEIFESSGLSVENPGPTDPTEHTEHTERTQQTDCSSSRSGRPRSFVGSSQASDSFRGPSPIANFSARDPLQRVSIANSSGPSAPYRAHSPALPVTSGSAGTATASAAASSVQELLAAFGSLPAAVQQLLLQMNSAARTETASAH